ncbi:MAG TPA: UDP-glucose 6-dehydrogenase, partial [Candidatus Thermoplasmatota archaeon]|nr:UDP-glucose 6-dehydrogenase [Candidatus Thermoplasmatota archaeon]
TAAAALADADAAVLQTEDPMWRELGPASFAALRAKLVVDGRRSFRAEEFEGTGVRYAAVGLGEPAA